MIVICDSATGTSKGVVVHDSVDSIFDLESQIPSSISGLGTLYVSPSPSRFIVM